MFHQQGRAHVTDPKRIEHVIKCRDGVWSTERENCRPVSVATDGPIHGTLAAAQAYNTKSAVLQGHPVPGTGPKKPSPTPSFKRNMVSQLIKQHGSPPHVRVTAGGRIVSNDLPQLGSPRMPYTPTNYSAAYGSSRGSARIPHALPNGNYGHSQLPQGYLAYNPSGVLIQFIDGGFRQVRMDEYGQPMYQMPPPNMPFPSANGVIGMMAPPPPQMHPMVSRSQPSATNLAVLTSSSR